MSKYQAYSEYKDSGIEWLKEIPKHWTTSKLRYKFAFGKGLTITKDNLADEGIPCVSYGEVHSKHGFEICPERHSLKCVTPTYLKTAPYALLQKGDIVFADTSEDIEGSGNFTQLVSDEMIFAGYHTIIARPLKKQSFRFYAYLLHSKELRTQVQFAVKGVKVFSITQAILKGINIWLPPINECDQIANFLDYETAKIDALIDKQEQLIKLLKEKRQAVISHAVTKGLNPDVSMKDSGVEWLGDVPKHWDVVSLKHLVDLNPSKAEVSRRFNSKCSFIPMEKLKTGSINLDEVRFVREVYDGYTYFRNGDVLLAKVTPCFENKNMAIASNLESGIGFGSSEIYVLRSKNEDLNEFLYFRLQENTFRNLAISQMTGAGGLKRVPSDFLSNFKLAIPSLSEGLEIVGAIKKLTEKYSQLIKNSSYQIQLMQERRTALISAAVTGKIDVRHWRKPDD